MLHVILLFVYLTTPDKQLIASVERAFYQNIKQIDKERHRNFTAQFKYLFQQQHSSPYQLYKEFILIDRKSEQAAKQKAVALKQKERNYVYYIGDIRSSYVADLLKRYRMSIDQRNMFFGNYCFCYVGKTESYCQDGKCKLDSNL